MEENKIFILTIILGSCIWQMTASADDQYRHKMSITSKNVSLFQNLSMAYISVVYFDQILGAARTQ